VLKEKTWDRTFCILHADATYVKFAAWRAIAI